MKLELRPTLKVHAFLLITAGRLARCWYALRALDLNGQGWIDVRISELESLLRRSRSTVYRTISDCIKSGFLLSCDLKGARLRIFYASRKRVIAHLNALSECDRRTGIGYGEVSSEEVIQNLNVGYELGMERSQIAATNAAKASTPDKKERRRIIRPLDVVRARCNNFRKSSGPPPKRVPENSSGWLPYTRSAYVEVSENLLNDPDGIHLGTVRIQVPDPIGLPSHQSFADSVGKSRRTIIRRTARMPRFKVYSCLNIDGQIDPSHYHLLEGDGTLTPEAKRLGYFFKGNRIWKRMPNLYVPKRIPTQGYLSRYRDLQTLGVKPENALSSSTVVEG